MERLATEINQEILDRVAEVLLWNQSGAEVEVKLRAYDGTTFWIPSTHIPKEGTVIPRDIMTK